MKGFLCVALFVALAAVAVRADDLDLDSTNFQSTITSNDYVLAMFYAPWCGHCKSLKPKFTEAANKVEGKYVLAKVDCTLDSGKELCQEFGVRGYPTLKFFKKGVPQDYNGPREVDGIISWLDKKSGPAYRELADDAAAKAFVAEGDSIKLVGHFASKGDASAKFTAAAEDPDMEDFNFGVVYGGSGSDGQIQMHLAGGRVLDFTGDLDGLAKWAFESQFPLVDEVGGHNFGKYAKLGKPLHLVFIAPDDANKDKIIEDLRTVADEHRDDAFTWIDAQKYNAQIKGMGASGDVVPCIIRLSSFGGDNKPVVFEKELTLDNLRDWAVGVKTGKYVYTPKSEPIPESNDGPVTVVVGKNYDEIVNNDSADVFLEFYAPWCGHCKTLAPKYEELGEAFKGVDGVTIAKIDGTANDVESHAEIKGFPTLLFYKSNDKTNPIPYTGAREVDAMKDFIKEHTTTKWNSDEL